MNAAEFMDALRDDHRTALSRLGSSKAVYALTAGEMNAHAVRQAAANTIHGAGELFGAWAAAGGGDAADLFGTIAADADRHYDLVAPDDHPEDGEFAAEMEVPADRVERLGATVGYLLVMEKWAEQFVGFFVGDADPTTADEFRTVRSDVADNRAEAAALLEGVASDEADWDVARAAAGEVIETAYDDYVETLESLGIEPKNVC